MSPPKKPGRAIYILFIIFTIVFFPVTAVLSFTVYILVYGLSCVFPNLGKFISCAEVWLDEEFVNSVPQNSIVISVSLQGDLDLNKLRSIFIANVVNARSNFNPTKLRYPELKQYLSNFICFRIWKRDPSFFIGNHIKEKAWNGLELASIHEEYLNKSFKKHQSPWELILIRNFNNIISEIKPTTLLVLRVHHIMADAKSLVKLLVECLGGKSLKTAKPQYIQRTCWDEICYCLNFPWKYVRYDWNVIGLLRNSFNHPWKSLSWLGNTENQTDKMVVAFSPEISLLDLKQVAAKNNVKTSAVVMSIIVESIKKFCGDTWDQDVAIGYPLPKPNHPEGLTNHVYTGTLHIPADQPNSFQRLQQCNDELVRRTKEQQGRYANIWMILGGVQMYPINRMSLNTFYPIGITNNAGEEEGFAVGNAECVDFRMSVGTLRGIGGVVFCTMSYKDGLRIAVIAKESILSNEVVDRIAIQIEYELQLLLQSPT